MSIPETQLKTWSNQGAVASSADTYDQLKRALAKYAWGSDVSYEVYLQGSYRNTTNIRGDSDVDAVVQLNSTFYYDETGLPEPDLSIWRRSFGQVTYEWSEFSADVLKSLRSYFGTSAVKEGKKSLKVAGGNGRLPADVVVCLQYRKYKRFKGWDDQDFIEGMKFYVPQENRWIINYPKVHYENGVGKNSSTNEWFKPSVRMFKNARSYLLDHGLLQDSVAPSYFVECLMYNVANHCYGGTFQDTFINARQYCADNDMSQFVCQNGQYPLFGDSPELWDLSKAYQYLRALVDLWSNWGNR